VTPCYPVHHGRVFSVAPPPAYISSPSATTPSTPTTTTIALPSKSLPAENGSHKKLVYMSDVSHIPDDKWAIIQSKQPGDDNPLPVLVVDCLGLKPHTSHYGFGDTVDTEM